MLTASLLASPASAGTPQWLGAVSTDWFTGGNWSPATVPTAGDTGVTIDTTSPNPAVINGGAAAGQQIFVGSIGTGNLTIQGGGVLTSTSGTLGNFLNGKGTVTVTGAGSAWNNSADLTIGNSGAGTLNISNGGAVTDVNANLGGAAGATGTVTVSGTNASWASSGIVHIGDVATGNMTISGGATASAANAYIAYGANSTGTATVTGANSSWNTGANLLVGFGGSGTLAVAQGGQVTVATGSIGNSAGSTGVATVDGTNSVWNNNTLLIVGGAGAGQLTVSNGGLVNSHTTRIGTVTGQTGTAIIDGAGSQFISTVAINLGQGGGTGNLTVRNGGSVSTSSLAAGFDAGAHGAVTLDGIGSHLSSSNFSYIGYNGSGSMSVSNGATFTGSFALFLGSNAGSSGALSVDGAGSKVMVTNSTNLIVGGQGSATMAISNGGSVSNFGGVIAAAAGTTGVVTVSGAGSSWINGDTLSVGDNGNATLTISNGGHVTSNVAVVAGHGGTSTAVLDGAGSTWTAGGLYVGEGGNGTLSVSNGGAATGTFALIGYANTGTVNIVGAGSSWAGSGDLYLGYQAGGRGVLNITGGGAFSNVSAFVGYGAGITGTVAVDGVGSVWSNGSAVSIGESGNGKVTLANNASMSAPLIRIAHNAGSTGELDIGAAPGAAAVAPGMVTQGPILFGAGTGAINFNHTATNYVFGSDIFGNGAINQFAGATTLSGGGAFTGQANVSGGTLWVDGAFGGASANVTSGGTLGGLGTIGATTVSGGTLVGGHAGGALSIQGSLVLSSAATYLVQVNGATAGRTAVTGGAALAGNVQVQLLGRVGATTSYTILTSSATSGTFGGVTVDNPAMGRNARLDYVGNSVLLTLDPGLLSPSLPNSASINQRNVAGGIDSALMAGANLPSAFNALFNLTGSNLSNALTQASGEVGTGSQQTTIQAMSQFLGTLLDPFIGGRSDATAPMNDSIGYAQEGHSGPVREAFAALYDKAPMARNYDPRWSVWVAGFGGSQTTTGNAVLGSNDTRSSLYGTAVGADYRISPNTLAGFALAGGGTSFSVANNLGAGRSDLFQAGAFVRHTIGPAYLSAALAYGWQDVTTDRTLTIAGIDRLRAQFNANAWSGRAEGGYRLVSQGVGWTPYAAGQFTTLDLPAYAEQVVSGADTFALAYAARTVTATRSELGLRTDKSFAMDDGMLTLRGRAAWAHDYNQDRNATATFQTLPGASFVVNGARQASDAALVSASAEKKWLNGWSAAAMFEGEFSSVTASYAGKGLVRYAW